MSKPVYGSRALQVSAIITIVLGALILLAALPILLVAFAVQEVDLYELIATNSSAQELLQHYPHLDIMFLIQMVRRLILPLFDWCGVLLLASGAFMLVTGIVGVLRWNDPWRSRCCVGWGIAQIVLTVLLNALILVLAVVWLDQLARLLGHLSGEAFPEQSQLSFVLSQIVSMATALVLPVIYLVGAVQNRRTAKRWAAEGWQKEQFPPQRPQWQQPQPLQWNRPGSGRYNPQTGVWQSGHYDPMTGQFCPDEPAKGPETDL